LSLLPIDECDLLAASGLDNLRVGPATETIIIRTFFRDRALKACQDAVRRERNNGRFWLNLARVFDDQTEYAAALESALKSAGLNYPAGYNAVGYQFDNRPPPLGPDLRLAKVYFERSLRLGNKYSLFNLAALAYREGDFAREFRLMTEYKDAGGYRLARLALFYARGASNPRGAANIVPEDAKKYIELLELGVRRRGDTHTYLAYELSLGLHVPQDLARSNELDETSVRLWHEPVSAANLSSYYFDADHAWQNEEKSTYWAIYAAKLGNARGLSILADLIASGRARFKPGYGPPDSFDILEIREKLAEGADATAAFKLAKDFEARGNRSKAVSWYQRAASKGHSEAEEALQRLKSE
jgi:TPR repeat protein